VVRVTWDRAKNLANQKKRDLSFEQASELFRSGVDYLELFDDEHLTTRTASSPSGLFGGAWSWSSGPSAMVTSHVAESEARMFSCMSR
jgi:hypothetical protein